MSDIVNEIMRKLLRNVKSIKKNQSACALRINNITQPVSLSLPKENSLFILFSADLCHVSGCKEAFYGMGDFMSGVGPHFPKLPHCMNTYLKDIL